MKRTRGNKPTAKASCIFCADVHLRPDRPVSRTDDFQQAMWGKVDFIIGLTKEHKCPLIIAGDLGHRPGVQNWPFWLQTKAMQKFSQVETILIVGQHDLQNHSLDLLPDSGVIVLHQDNAIQIQLEERTFKDFHLQVFPWNAPLVESTSISLPSVAVAHMTVIEDRKLWPDMKAPQGHELLKKYGYDLIVTGDNHIPFLAEYQGRKLINCGSMMRTAANQMQHKPRIYLWYADTNTVEAVYLPIEQDVLSREHIDRQNSQDERFSAYVRQNKKIEQQGELSLSFEANMEAYFAGTRVRKPVKAKVIEAMV